MAGKPVLTEGSYGCKESGKSSSVPYYWPLEITQSPKGIWSACLWFDKKHRSCGTQNSKYGVRKDEYDLYSVRFDGYEDFTGQSHTSLPGGTTPRIAVLNLESNPTTFRIRPANSRNSDLVETLDCIRTY